MNHNESAVHQMKKGLRIRTNFKAGGARLQHNETPVRLPNQAR